MAPVKWAQRADFVYLTIAVADVDATECKIDLTEKKLTFSGISNGKNYELDLEFVSIERVFLSNACILFASCTLSSPSTV